MAYKEIKINSLVQSDQSIKHYQAIKTRNKMYMIQDYSNCLDLSVLLQERGTIRQEEARIIMKKLV